MVEQRTSVAPEVSGVAEAPKTGAERLAGIYGGIFKDDIYSVIPRYGIQLDEPRKGLREKFLDQVLSDESITREDLAQLLAEAALEATFARVARRYPDYIHPSGGNPMACR